MGGGAGERLVQLGQLCFTNVCHVHARQQDVGTCEAASAAPHHSWQRPPHLLELYALHRLPAPRRFLSLRCKRSLHGRVVPAPLKAQRRAGSAGKKMQPAAAQSARLECTSTGADSKHLCGSLKCCYLFYANRSPAPAAWLPLGPPPMLLPLPPPAAGAGCTRAHHAAGQVGGVVGGWVREQRWCITAMLAGQLQAGRGVCLHLTAAGGTSCRGTTFQASRVAPAARKGCASAQCTFLPLTC